VSQPQSITEWAKLILQRRPNRSGAWSLCEIGLSETEFETLTIWAKTLSFAQFSQDARNRRSHTVGTCDYKGRAVLGLVLFLVESETARRKASEGSVWPCIRNIGWGAEVAEALFTAQGGASITHRMLLQEAAERFELRHLFGQEGVHSWIDSIFLQFGFTHQGSAKRLEVWLNTQHMPVAVAYLLQSRQADTQFKAVWNCLRAVSQSKTHSAQQERLLKDSPWVLPSWSTQLLESAKRARSRADASDADFGAVFLVQSVRLIRSRIHDVSSYEFEVELCDLGELNLEEPGYHVLWDNQVIGYIGLRDGAYVLAGERLALPTHRPESEIALRAVGGAEIGVSQRLTLWDPNDIVTVYNPAGERLPENTKGGLRRGCHIIYHHCLQLRGETECVARLSESWMCATLTLLANTVQLVAGEDEVLWDAAWVSKETTASACVGMVAAWRSAGASYQEEKAAKIRLSIPTGIHVVSAYFNGRRVELPKQEGGSMDFEVVLVASDFFSEPRLRTAVRIGEDRYSVVLPMGRLWAPAVFVENAEGEVKRWPVERTLRTDKARSAKFLFPNQWENFEKAVLMEGHRVVCGADGAGPQRVQGLSGYGAPLTLVRDRFNSHGNASRFVVAQKVRNADGILRSVKDHGTEVSLWLNQERPPGVEDAVVMLDAEGVWHSFSAVDIVVNDTGTQWTIPISGRVLPPVACLAVVYQNTVIGGWQHPTEFRRLLLEHDDPVRVREFAACVRAFKLPFLEHCSRGDYRKWTQSHLSEVLAAWLCPVELKLGAQIVKVGYPDELWLDAVQEFFSAYKAPVTQSHATGLIRTATDVDSEQLASIQTAFAPLEDTIRLLTDVSPWLAAGVARTFLAGVGLGATEQKQLRGMLSHFVDYTPDAWEQSIFHVGVDPSFWDRLVNCAVLHERPGQELRDADHWNVCVALKTPGFRRRLTALLLKTEHRA